MDSTTPNLILLIFGLLPFAYCIYLVVRNGFQEAISLRPTGIVFFWIGYHLSPWIYYLTGEKWDFYLLVPGEINTGLLFSTLCSVLYLLGYGYIFKKKFVKYGSSDQKVSDLFQSPMVVCILSIVVLASLALISGGWGELWVSSKGRGVGQFEQRDFYGTIIQMFTVLQLPLNIALIISSSLLLVKRGNRYLEKLTATVGIFISLLPGINHFSRSAGFPLLLVFFLAVRMKGKKILLWIPPVIILVIFFGNVGLSGRAYYNPGIGNFVHAAVNLNDVSISNNHKTLADWINPLDAQAPFTRKVSSIFEKHPFVWEQGLKLIWNVNPLPSEIVPIFPIGEDLSLMMGTWGSTGITTPAFAELYYVFGYTGSLAMLIVGIVAGWFELRCKLDPTAINYFSVIIAFAMFPLGLHSSLRAMTRPIVYSLLLITISKIFTRKRKIQRKTMTCQ